MQLYVKNLTDIDQVQIVMYDLLGREVFTSAVSLSEGSIVERLDISSVPRGLYVYSVYDESGALLHSDRLVIEK